MDKKRLPIDIYLHNRKMVNLAFLVDSSMGQTILSSDLDNEGIPVYSATMDDNPFGYLKPTKNKICLRTGDIVVPARGNSIGYVTLVKDSEATCTQTTIALKMICPLISKYIYYYFKTYQKILFEYVGGAIPQITLTMISNIVIPLPPLQEQQRIVAKLDELFALIDKIEKEQDELEEYKKLAKEKVLELAVTGKLVKQDPNDEPASALLERIKRKKEALIKAGKIKKDKTDNEPLSDDDKNYYQNLPNGWSLIRLNDICLVRGGKRIPAGEKFSETKADHKYVRVSDMQNGTVISCAYISDAIFQQIKNYTINDDDIYITVAGTIGRVGTVPNEYHGANLTENADKLILNKNINKEWFIYYLNSAICQNQISHCTTKVGQPKLAIKNIEQLLLGLPPKYEQEKIASVTNSLLSEIKNLSI